MAIITLLGAGSTVFAKNLLGDILSFPELANSEIRLFDIDSERLKTSEVIANKVAQALGAKQPTAKKPSKTPTTPSPCFKSVATSPQR
jgi:alpha-galactosidase/6-phospho-beta-glucosidase family protein